MSNIQRTSQWVKGHKNNTKKDDQLTPAEKLNIKMDKKAADAYDMDIEWTSNTVGQILPATKWAYMVNGEKIMTKLI